MNNYNVYYYQKDGSVNVYNIDSISIFSLIETHNKVYSEYPIVSITKIDCNGVKTTVYKGDYVMEKGELEGYDNINQPQHYMKGIETYDYINSWDMSFTQGNIVKYVTRYQHKNGVEDLKKAKWYLDKLIEENEK